ncbi:hypothetical protein D9757_007389 [Collybiopsis confluens]|uniref:DUF6533 domain-containing protein n=1 Tax=Collybiopsis confluens TaxID=2823264 RepID=A0A8H5M7M8_9AGAR|nr:hypothetical protein D9757_007389 [Collybiopsis confluens]
MSSASLTDLQLQALAECVANRRIGQGIIYATSTLFMYDYILTVWDELSVQIKYIWRRKKMTIGSISLFLARYAALAEIIISLQSVSTLDATAISSTATVLRLVSIVASEVIIAARTWAIWGRNRNILIALVVFALAAAIPAVIIICIGIKTSRVKALVTDEFIDICNVVMNGISQEFIVLYICAILYEFVTLSLSLTRILSWRKTIPNHIRAPIIDNLWMDVLGFMNIGIVMQRGIPQLRVAGSQLQMVMHSVLSARIVLHLARSKGFRDISTPGSAMYQTSTGIHFTSEFAGETMREAEIYEHSNEAG